MIDNINRILKVEAEANSYPYQMIVTLVERIAGLHPFNKEAYIKLEYKLLDIQTKELTKVQSISYNRKAKVATSIGFNFDDMEQRVTDIFKFRQELLNEKEIKETTIIV